MKEKLVPVTSESQLKPGLLVEVKDCRSCGRRRCRDLIAGMLNSRNCQVCGLSHLRVRPLSSCDLYSRPYCMRSAIRDRRLFIVDTGLEDDTLEQAVVEHAVRKRERV